MSNSIFVRCQHLAASKFAACCLSSLLTFIICDGFWQTRWQSVSFELKNFQQIVQGQQQQIENTWQQQTVIGTSSCLCTNETGQPTDKAPNAVVHSKPIYANLSIYDIDNIPNVVIRYTNESRKDQCPLVTGRRILINYAAFCCRISQPLNCQTGIGVGGFDVCISFSEKSLDADFKSRNQKIFLPNINNPLVPLSRFWLWKPYIILKTLLAMRDDDVLFYADSGSHFVDNFDLGPVCLQAERGDDITLFTYECAEQKYTKADAYVLMGCFDDICYNGTQLTAAFILLRKTFRSIQFVSQWLTYAQDYRIVSNDASQLQQEKPEFAAHRNDQSVVSLLSKKWRLSDAILPDPSQWGEANDFGRQMRGLNRFKRVSKTFIHHTRNKA